MVEVGSRYRSGTLKGSVVFIENVLLCDKRRFMWGNGGREQGLDIGKLDHGY